MDIENKVVFTTNATDVFTKIKDIATSTVYQMKAAQKSYDDQWAQASANRIMLAKKEAQEIANAKKTFANVDKDIAKDDLRLLKETYDERRRIRESAANDFKNDLIKHNNIAKDAQKQERLDALNHARGLLEIQNERARSMKGLISGAGSFATGMMSSMRGYAYTGLIGAGIGAGYAGVSSLHELSQHSRSTWNTATMEEQNQIGSKANLENTIKNYSNMSGIDAGKLASAVYTAKKHGGTLSPEMIEELSKQMMLNPDLEVGDYSKASGKLQAAGIKGADQISTLRRMQMYAHPGSEPAEEIATKAILLANSVQGSGYGNKANKEDNIVQSAQLLQILSASMSADQASTALRRMFSQLGSSGPGQTALNLGQNDWGSEGILDQFQVFVKMVQDKGKGNINIGLESVLGKHGIRDAKQKDVIKQFVEDYQSASPELKQKWSKDMANEEFNKRISDIQQDSWVQLDQAYTQIKNSIGESIAPAIKELASFLSTNKGTLKAMFDFLVMVGEWALKNPWSALIALNVDSIAVKLYKLGEVLNLVVPSVSGASAFGIGAGGSVGLGSAIGIGAVAGMGLIGATEATLGLMSLGTGVFPSLSEQDEAARWFPGDTVVNPNSIGGPGSYSQKERLISMQQDYDSSDNAGYKAAVKRDMDKLQEEMFKGGEHSTLIGGISSANMFGPLNAHLAKIRAILEKEEADKAKDKKLEIGAATFTGTHIFKGDVKAPRLIIEHCTIANTENRGGTQ